MKSIATFLFFLNPILWASYYTVTKDVLERIDPLIFGALDMLVALPFGIVILFFARRQITWFVISRGVLLGSLLALVVVIELFGLDRTTATNSAFIGSLVGFMAILFAFLVLRQKFRGAVWLAGLVSAAGAILLVLESPNSGGDWTGDALGLLSTVVFMIYIFATDKVTADGKLPLWPCYGVQLVTMTVLIGGGSLAFADWGNLGSLQQSDYLIVAYVGIGTTVLPYAVSLFFQRFVSPVTVAILYGTEPLWCAVFAHLYLAETLTTAAYVGGGLIALGVLAHSFIESLAEDQVPAVQVQAA